MIDTLRRTRTDELLALCRSVVAGGESSAARLSNPTPIVMSHGEGSRFWDVDGNEYLDWCCGYGPLIFGHRPTAVTAAVVAQLQRGSLFTLAHELDYEVGRKICASVPGCDLVRFCNSGTEATMAAIRLARAWTGKEKILKFEGMYHGWSDVTAISTSPPLEAAGPERQPRPVRVKRGIPAMMEDAVIVGCYNDAAGAERLIRAHRDELAAVIAEPVAANCGLIPPAPGWIETLRRCTRENGVLLIFDEVITGFRVALGGAQELYGVQADITAWGKALGGGFPGAAAFGGSREVMQLEADGEVLHAGTYSGNPLALAAMNATLDTLTAGGSRFYGHLAMIGEAVCRGLRDVFEHAGLPAQVNHVNGIWQVFFSREPVTRTRAARRADMELYRRFQQEMQARGVYFHDDGLEIWFACSEHSEGDVERTIEAARQAAAVVRR